MVDHVSESTSTTAVGVTVPARFEQLVMLRALAETVALIADFALDEATDIRLALDEVATSLIADAVPDSQLTCQFDYDEDRMTVRVTGLSTVEAPPDPDSFAWHIVRTLTRSVHIAQQSFDPAAGGYRTEIEFTWVRAGGLDGSR